MFFENRINALREMMKERRIFGMYITSPENVFYLSGFTGFGDVRLFITLYDAYIITDSRYTLQVAIECPNYELISGSSASINILKPIIEEKQIYVIGFENDLILYADYNKLVSSYKNVEFVGVNSFFLDVRDVKDSIEAEYIRKACEISCNSLKEVLTLIKPGVCENEIAIELEYKMKKNGANDIAFDTIVASGARSALPHGTASNKKIEIGDAVTIDFGCKYNNYCSDMTRTFFVGNPCEEMKKIYDVVYKAQKAALEGYRAGMTGKELDNISREIISQEGYGKYFGHSLGHGVGIEVHEGATIGPNNDNKIEIGTVFSVEPGIYIENLGGVRIEDLVWAHGETIFNMTKSFDKKMLVL